MQGKGTRGMKYGVRYKMVFTNTCSCLVDYCPLYQDNNSTIVLAAQVIDCTSELHQREYSSNCPNFEFYKNILNCAN